MAFAELLARDGYAPGTYNFGPVSVSTGTTLTLRLERFETRPNGTRKPNTEWPIELSGTPLFLLTLERKFVGGGWQPWCQQGPKVPGGVILRKPPHSSDPPEESQYERIGARLQRGEPNTRWLGGDSGAGRVFEQFQGTFVVNIALQTQIEWEAT